ncbi:hypothetical protein Cgig2_011472 [Carnegiea gigantea]|uniref:Serine/threonine-protein phosphatase 2A 55 kDa regulatory subunit B n=1 Tax=Carnegiea gigantea TaxID=171969 RepID=A0A9Q1KU30_9CARY|nr:hypothetical protein Cgig2_011472 [Carnegiea gigantea]
MKRGGGTDGSVALPPPPLEWKFSQVFGERLAGEEIQEVDIISAIEFDKTGDHLATGDRGGRVVLFERTDRKGHVGPRKDVEKMDCSTSRHPEFRYQTEFQSHEPEFDYLKSLEIEEKINKIRWCQMANGALFLLSTNDKTIKFWKELSGCLANEGSETLQTIGGTRAIVQEKKIKKACNVNVDPSKTNGSYPPAGANTPASPKPSLPNGGCDVRSANYVSSDFSFPPGGIAALHLPTVTSQETSLVARCRRIYAHAHDYHINSISNNSDGETFISADDLRINLWNLETSSQSFNIVDVKPTNMEDLTEVITSAEFHPTHCNMLAYSSSKGSIRLIDLRQSALCDTHSKLFEVQEAPGTRSFFTEIIASISDVKFARDGRYMLSRDYMTLKALDHLFLERGLRRCGAIPETMVRREYQVLMKINNDLRRLRTEAFILCNQLWDINMDSGPVTTFQVHEHLRPRLCDLYENDSIFDKFECCLSGDGRRVATGSYRYLWTASNLFRVFGCASGSTEATTLEASKNPMRKQIPTPTNTRAFSRTARRGLESPGADANGGAFDSSTKLLHLAWHPTENSIACAASNSLYMYYA